MKRIAIATALLIVGTSAGAQSRPRVGYAGTAKPAPEQTRPTTPTPVIIYNNGAQNQQGYIINGAPYLVLNDGTVLVNFGNGYERVLRACPPANNNATQTDKFGLDALGNLPLPLLNGGERGQTTGTMPARNEAACYRVSRQRHVHIVKG
jgi:hypothetical protein